jgi:hypothetical protein
VRLSLRVKRHAAIHTSVFHGIHDTEIPCPVCLDCITQVSVILIVVCNMADVCVVDCQRVELASMDAGAVDALFFPDFGYSRKGKEYSCEDGKKRFHGGSHVLLAGRYFPGKNPAIP